jgi:tRNA (guanosine-2'-O-)-methyltransferase
MKQLDGTGMKRLHRKWRASTSGRLALILDGLGTPVNVGSIVRTAAAYRVDHVWIAGPTPAFDAPGVAKTALGTDRYLTSTISPTALESIAEAKAKGYRIVGIELADEATALHQIDLTGDLCLVIGHEDHGIGKAAMAACDAVAYLPMLGKVGSLNVAVAASLAMYEVRRQGWTSTTPET